MQLRQNVALIQRFNFALLIAVFVVSLATRVAAAATPAGGGDDLNGPSIVVDIVVDPNPQPGSAHDRSFRSIVTGLFEGLRTGDQLRLWVADRVNDDAKLDLRKAHRDDPAVVSHLWPERVSPALGKHSADLVNELRSVMSLSVAPRETRMIVLLLSRQLTSEASRGLWDVALEARDHDNLLVIVGPDEDVDGLGLILKAAGAGVLRFDPLSHAEPVRWIEKLRPVVAGTPVANNTAASTKHDAQALEQIRHDLEKQNQTIALEQRQRQEQLRQQQELVHQQRRDLEDQIAKDRADRDARDVRTAMDGQRIVDLQQQLESNSIVLEHLRAQTQQLAQQQQTLKAASEAKPEREPETEEPEVSPTVSGEEPPAITSNHPDEVQNPGTPAVSAIPVGMDGDVPAAQDSAGRKEKVSANQEHYESETASTNSGDGRGTVARRGTLLVLLGVVAVIAWCIARTRQRACRVNLKWLRTPGQSWSPLDLNLNPRHEVIAIPVDAPPRIARATDLDGQASLAVIGRGLELRDERADAALTVNNDTVAGTHQRLRVGDSIQVRHPDGHSTCMIVCAIDRIPHQAPPAVINSTPAAAPA